MDGSFTWNVLILNTTANSKDPSKDVFHYPSAVDIFASLCSRVCVLALSKSYKKKSK